MKSSRPSRLRTLRLEAAEGPRIDLSGPTRREHDLLGERDVPAGALYGIQTLRAMENFCISGIELREFPTFVAALATVKEAAALANLEMKLIDRQIVDAISQAAGEIREGLHHDHFRVDMIQGGAGTSSNMNVNEVMANRALEILGKQRGQYDTVHPNNHLNLSQSTNDVYPTSVKLALHTSISDLQLAMISLAAAFLHKGEEFATCVTIGRTQPQSAVTGSRSCNDLRLLSSGPRAGFGEITLPPVQPGSSIMPGKVNPVIPEVVNQVCFDIIGGDVTVTMAAEAGQLQLNVFEPIIAFRLLSGMTYLTRACKILQDRCIEGITANAERMRGFVEHSVGLVTALVPLLGYETTTEIAK